MIRGQLCRSTGPFPRQWRQGHCPAAIAVVANGSQLYVQVDTAMLVVSHQVYYIMLHECVYLFIFEYINYRYESMQHVMSCWQVYYICDVYFHVYFHVYIICIYIYMHILFVCFTHQDEPILIPLSMISAYWHVNKHVQDFQGVAHFGISIVLNYNDTS